MLHTAAQEYVDVETAKQTGRAAFGEMVAYLKAHPSVRVMLVEKTDRLLKDWGDGGRTGRGNALPKGRRGAVAGVAFLGKVQASPQE